MESKERLGKKHKKKHTVRAVLRNCRLWESRRLCDQSTSVRLKIKEN